MTAVSFTLCGVKRIPEFVCSHLVQRNSSPSEQAVSRGSRSIHPYIVNALGKIATVNGGF